jgi:hypothetical protein
VIRRVMPVMAILMLALTGCAAPRQQTSVGYVPPAGNHKVIVMRPDIAVDVLTVGGLLERREDWTITARDNVLAALQTQQAKRGGQTQVAITRESAGGEDSTVIELNKLHQVVGQSVLVHKFTPMGTLPTKKDAFDWTLGELAVQYGTQSGYDYAFFLYARDSFSSSGRAALQAVGALGCIVGVCVIPPGGTQQAFASLVELKTGKLVWFNHVLSATGDIRTQAGANALVSKLLEGMNPETQAKKKKKA